METESRGKPGFGWAVVILLLLGAGLGVGGFALHASRGRQLQLHDDEVGRQRNAVLNAIRAVRGATAVPTTTPAAPGSSGA